jgi:hypothetical protein
LLSQKKETKEKATPLPSQFACHFSGLANRGSQILAPFGLSAASERLRNWCFQHSNSPRHLASAAQAEGAAKGSKVNTIRMPLLQIFL